MLDDWIEYRKLVLQELERLTKTLDSSCSQISEIRNDLSLLSQEIYHNKEKWGDDLKEATDRINEIIKTIDSNVLKSSSSYNDIIKRIDHIEDILNILGDPVTLLKSISELNHRIDIIQLKSGLWGAIGASLPVIAGVVSIILSK